MSKKGNKTCKPPSRLLKLLRTALVDRMQAAGVPMHPNYAQIDRVIAESGTNNFESLIDDLVRQCVIFDGRFLVRAQYLAARELFYWDRSSPGQPIPESLATEILPRLQTIEKHLLDLVENYSTFKHTMSLTRKPRAVPARKLRKSLHVVGRAVKKAG
jgi:hypothetical protein